MYKLCDSSNGFTHCFKIYEGKDLIIDPPACSPFLGISAKIVWNVILGQEYLLYLDKFYNSILLLKFLLSRSTLAFGTISKNHRYLPKVLMGHTLQKGKKSVPS